MKRFDRQISPDRGKICYLLILIIKIKYSAAETTTPAITEMDEEHIRLMAVDCTTNDERIRPSKCTMANLMTYEKTMMVHLLQKVSVLAIPGVRCVVKKSSHTWYCGKYRLKSTSPCLLLQMNVRGCIRLDLLRMKESIYLSISISRIRIRCW